MTKSNIYTINQKKTIMKYIAKLLQDELSLCSKQGIKIGDKVSDGFCKPVEWTTMMNSCFPQDNYYKVVGKISPEATWVKPDMEFEDEDVKILVHPDKVSSKAIAELLGGTWLHKENHIRTKGEVAYVQIKGSDGIFY